MRKIFKTALLPLAALLLALSLVPSVFAYDASLDRVLDYTGTLDDSERSRLASTSEDFRREYSMDCVFLLTGSLGGKSAAAYADDAYDYGGYGMGDRNSGVLFLISTGEREVYISTCGEAINQISDLEIEYILDDMMDALRDGDWARAFRDGAGSAGDAIETRNAHSASRKNDTGARLAAVFLAPAVIALLSVGIMWYMTSGAHGKFSAADYAVKNSFRLTGALDIFLSSHVSKTPRASESSGGGGSSHSSSSGVSHGGGGRHF